MTTKIKYPLLTTVINTTILLTLTACQSDEKQALDYLQSAQQYYDNEQYSLASVEIKNAIRKDSTLAEPYLLQANIFAMKKNWEAMHAFLATTLQQQPKHVEANIEIAKLYAKGHNIVTAQRHLDIAVKEGVSAFEQHLVQGIIYMNDKKLEQAVKQANAALEIDAISIDASLLSASLSILLEEYNKALSITNKALSLHPKSDLLLLMKSKIYSVQGDFEQAANHAEILTTLFPKELSYHYLLAALRDRAGDEQGAELALKQATLANPENSKAKIALAGYISQQDKTLAAIDLLSLYIESEPTSANEQLRLILAELHQKQGQISQATTIYESLSKTDNKFSFTAKNKLALIALKDNRQKEALNILNDILRSDFANTQALITRSIIYLSDQRTNQAITDLLSAVREDPKSELALMLLSRAYKQNNNNELAIQTLGKLLKTNPAHKEAALQYSQLLYQEGNYKAAIGGLKMYLDTAGPSSDIQEHLMRAYLADKNWREAKKLAQTIAQTSKQPEHINYTDAIILQRTKKYNQSTNMLKTLVQKNLFVHQSLKAIVYNYRKLNKTNEALQYLVAYSKNHPNNLFTISLIVTEYRRDQQFALAEAFLSNALVNNNDWSNGHLQLAKLYAAQAKWDDAISSGLKALSQNKGKHSIDALLLLASSYGQTNNYKQAERFYRDVLKQSPNIQSAANNLALLLAGDGKNAERVEEAFQIAKRFEQSNQPLFIDTLGWIYFLRQDYQQAVLLLEKAIFSAPDEAVIHFHLGATLLELSEFNKARVHLEKSRELGINRDSFKDYDTAKILLEKLTQYKKHKADPSIKP